LKEQDNIHGPVVVAGYFVEGVAGYFFEATFIYPKLLGAKMSLFRYNLSILCMDHLPLRGGG